MGKFLLGILTGVAGLAVAAVITNQLDCRSQKNISDRAKPVDENEADDDTEAESDDEADVETNAEAEETSNDSSASAEKIIERNAPFLEKAIKNLKQAGNLL